MIELFPQLCQEKIQFTAFVDPKLVTFLREQYTLLKTAFKRFRVSVKVCAVQILETLLSLFHAALCVQILKLDSVEKVTKECLDEWNIVLVCHALPRNLLLQNSRSCCSHNDSFTGKTWLAT